MKPYFSKLLTEKERRGSRNPSRKTGGRIRIHPDPEHEYEDEVTRRPVSRRRQYGQGYMYKEFSDVLTPLEGFLRKNVGRPWDDVYSELCQNLDRRSVSGQHVFQHLWGFVVRHTFIGKDGHVWYRDRYGERSISSGFRRQQFYIGPESGLLRLYVSPRIRYTRGVKKEDPNEIPLKDGSKLARLKEVWYHVEYKRIESWVWFLGRKEVTLIEHKRQLNSKEIRTIVVPYLSKL